MYVEKFEAETLDEALKAIKNKLGPDAIILKTKTNKGLAGTFSKAKYEITAAISERTYEKKAKVDHVFNPEQKEQFYNAPSSQISQMIDNYNDSPAQNQSNSNTPSIKGYGKMGLNKMVKQAQDKVKSGLDDFLGSKPERPAKQLPANNVSQQTRSHIAQNFETPTVQVQPQMSAATNAPATNKVYEAQIDKQQQRIDQLEQQIHALTKGLQEVERKDPIGIHNFRCSLKALDINEAIIRDIVNKANLELSDSDLDNEDIVFEFGLNALASLIEVDLPMFSKTENEPVITVLISDSTSGQTSMSYKLASLVDNAAVVQFGEENRDYKLAKKVFDLKYAKTKNLSELISKIRKFHQEGRKVFVDYKALDVNNDDTKRFIQGLRRGFKDVEVLTCLSAIHSELYNKKQVNRHRDLSDGLVVTNLDLCMNFGSLINLQFFNRNLPYKFFANGRVIPEDLESASKERILGGLFNFGET